MRIPASKTALTLALLAAVGLGAALVSFGRMQAAAVAPAAPTSVAVVDIRKAMDVLKEAEAVRAALDARGTEIKKELDKRTEALKALKEKIQMQTPGTPAWSALDAQFTELALQRESYAKMQQGRFGIASDELKFKLYRQICARAAKLAETKGYDILLDNTYAAEEVDKVEMDKIPSDRLGSVVSRFLGGDRTLLFARKTVDLTDDLIAVMNNEFNQRGGAPAPAAPTAPAAAPLGPTLPAPRPQ